MTIAHDRAWFPGRVIGGTALILGPVVWWLGWILRFVPTRLHLLTPTQRHHFDGNEFAGPMELAMYHQVPELMTLAFAAFLLGAVLLFPAVITLARLAAPRAPHLAAWGGVLFVLGLFARAYFAGVDQTAFQISEEIGVKPATAAIMHSYVDITYGPWRVAVWLSVGQYLGTALLAAAAHKSGILGTGRLILLLASGTTWMGVLKDAGAHDGTLPFPLEPGLLCIVLVPMGVQVLRNRLPAPQPRRPLLSW